MKTNERKRGRPKLVKLDLTRVSHRVVAEVIGRTPSKVRDYVNRDILPKPTDSKYDLPACVQAYVHWVKRGHANAVEFDARKSVLEEKYKSLKLENDKRAGRQVDTEEVEDVFTRVCSLIAVRLEAIPGRLANELAGMTDAAQIRARLRHEIVDIRTSAESGLKDFVRSVKGRGAIEGATDPDASDVGRRKPRLTSRKRRARSIPE